MSKRWNNCGAQTKFAIALFSVHEFVTISGFSYLYLSFWNKKEETKIGVDSGYTRGVARKCVCISPFPKRELTAQDSSLLQYTVL
jgi:hypothetical protein